MKTKFIDLKAKNIAKLSALLAVIVMLSGCGTFFGRQMDNPDIEYFKSLDTSMQLLGFGGQRNDHYVLTRVCYMMIVCPIATVVTIPADALVDIVMLPIDFLESNDDAEES
ncbi:YceK/YidQ family lipoprotein [Pseudomonas sp. NPDC098747]|uniref:YceK/YidQ family lipoprotein n=1 Tax=Pseudomonas sp. NPDC098747 TaxID=3364487 RepID=UPI00383B0B92